MQIIWTSWAGPDTAVTGGTLEATVINILPGVIPMAPPSKGSHPEQGARGNCLLCIPGLVVVPRASPGFQAACRGRP